MPGSDLKRAINALKAGSHVCLIFESDAEWEDTLFHFISEGIERQERCIIMTGEQGCESLCGALRKRGIDIDEKTGSGQIVIVKSAEGGEFNPERHISRLREASAAAERDGFRALRVTGDDIWSRSSPGRPEPLLSFEAALNGIDSDPPCTILCKYDLRSCGHSVLTRLMMAHPFIIWKGVIHQNCYYLDESSGKNDGHPAIQWLSSLAERKKMLESLKLKENAIDNAVSGITLLDLEGKITYVNGAMLNIWGYDSAEEIVGRKVSRFFHNPDVARGLIALLRSGRKWKGELIGRRKDHSTFTAQITATLVRDSFGIPAAMMASAVDTTEQKMNEEELHQYQQHLRDLVDEKTSEMESINRNLTQEICERKEIERALRQEQELYTEGKVVVFRWKAEEQWPVEYVSPSISQFGYSTDEFYQKKILYGDIIHSEDLDRITDEVAAYSQSDADHFEQEYRIVTKDGSRRTIYDYTNIIRDADGATTHYHGYILDITSRKEAEENLRLSLREKEILLDELNHRVKNNLQIISSLMDMSYRRTKSDETASILKEACGRIHTMALIHSYLYRNHQMTRIDIADFARELLYNLSQIYCQSESGIKTSVTGRDIYLAITQAIPAGMALHELISNAYKHAFSGKTGGWIRVKLDKSPAGLFSLQVSDDGGGMSADFSPMSSGGLGMKLIRTIVEDQLQGNVRFSGDAGTEVMITFQARQ
jgi:PAS domain S-box-containing protein